MTPLYLGLDALCELAAAIGLPGQDLAFVEPALMRPRAGERGVEEFPTLATKAAALLVELVGHDPQIAGGPALGWAAARLFLLLNGQADRPDSEIAVAALRAVAAGELGIQQVAELFDPEDAPGR